MDKKLSLGIAAALFSIIVWSSTYISTKILVQDFSALQISLIRFTIGLTLLCILSPPKLKGIKLKQEIRTAAAGVMGIFLYYFLENLATKYTYASNVSVIVTSIPLLTSLIAQLFYKEERFKMQYLFAFFLTMTGFLLVLSQSGEIVGISKAGDFLALGAAVVFAMYTLLVRSIANYASPLALTRKSFFYGWVCIVVASLLTGQIPGLFKIIQPQHIGHLLFLGLIASGMCFTTWAYSVKTLGPVRSSQFIYLVPFITVTLSILILNEQFTFIRGIGMFCIVAAVVLSQIDFKKHTIN